MDINPLIADLNKYKEELISSIEIAIGLNELHKADKYVAHDMVEIKGKKFLNDPFMQIAYLYSLPREEVVINIRAFTNKEYKSLFPFDPRIIEEINFNCICDEEEK